MSTLTKVKDNVIVKSEVTSNAHVAEGEGVQVFQGPNGREIHCDGKSVVTISHQEHKPVVMPPNNYRTGIVREMDHVAEEARSVID